MFKQTRKTYHITIAQGGPKEMRIGKHLNTPTPQSQPIPGREAQQVKNSAGGYTFKIDPWQSLQRFLILGTEGGTYYITESKLTLDNIANVRNCISLDGSRVVREVLAISEAGRAVKNDAAIFALAAVIKFGNEDSRKEAYKAVPKVCRIGTHVFTLAQALKDLEKGWGRGVKKAFASWYLDRDVDGLAYQVAKYQNRNGWTNADILRLSHPKTTNPKTSALFKWVVDGVATEAVPELIEGVEKAKATDKVETIVSLIKQYSLPRECIPTKFLNEKKVWAELLKTMPLTAMIRNLATMTKNNLLTPVSDETQTVIARLSDANYIKKSRVHPITILLALKQYSLGRGFKGNATWNPVPTIIAALDKAFYLSFDNVEATGKNFYFGIDVSGSMNGAILNTNLSHSEAAAAMMMAIMKVEPKYYTYGFQNRVVDLKLNSSMDLGTVVKTISNRTYGGTDCSLPMVHALEEKFDVDCFVVITDNETWTGNIHASQALATYRKAMNKPNAKLIVLATAGNNFTIADPNDPNMLDFCGFDSSVPSAINEFCRI